METVTIRKIFRDVKNTPRGKATLTAIYVMEYPDVRMSSFDNTDGIKEGDKIQVVVTKKGDFTNFKLAGGKRVAASTNNELEARVKKLEDAVFGDTKTDAGTAEVAQEEFEDF